MFDRTSPVFTYESCRFPAYNFAKKKRLCQRCFWKNFANFIRKSFLLTEHLGVPASCVYLWILVSFKTSYRERLRETAISWTSCRILLTRYSKNYFTCAFQAFYTKTRRSHSKSFIYLKSSKTVSEYVILSWSCEMPTRKFTKNLLHTSSFIFSECITINSSEEALKKCKDNFFLEI